MREQRFKPLNFVFFKIKITKKNGEKSDRDSSSESESGVPPPISPKLRVIIPPPANVAMNPLPPPPVIVFSLFLETGQK